jgi:hypothetical protein
LYDTKVTITFTGKGFKVKQKFFGKLSITTDPSGRVVISLDNLFEGWGGYVAREPDGETASGVQWGKDTPGGLAGAVVRLGRWDNGDVDIQLSGNINLKAKKIWFVKDIPWIQNRTFTMGLNWTGRIRIGGHGPWVDALTGGAAVGVSQAVRWLTTTSEGKAAVRATQEAGAELGWKVYDGLQGGASTAWDKTYSGTQGSLSTAGSKTVDLGSKAGWGIYDTGQGALSSVASAATSWIP